MRKWQAQKETGCASAQPAQSVSFETPWDVVRRPGAKVAEWTSWLLGCHSVSLRLKFHAGLCGQRKRPLLTVPRSPIKSASFPGVVAGVVDLGGEPCRAAHPVHQTRPPFKAAGHLTEAQCIRQRTRQPSPPSSIHVLQASRFGSRPSPWRIQPDAPRPSPPTRADTRIARPPSRGTWTEIHGPSLLRT